MWGHWQLNQLSSDGGAELVNVSPWAVIAVAVMWCVCLVLVWGRGFLCEHGAPAVILLGSCSVAGPLDVCCLDFLRVCLRSRGAGLWLFTLAIAYFYGETLYTLALGWKTRVFSPSLPADPCFCFLSVFFSEPRFAYPPNF
ncbi:hypothetical protein XENOCAPTIV_013116 [Xenoophorus captivus]|uniref:Uncharacterized protein n=1 Tax=Xenoophorus captivus TaxID=1517983 RepID=A0ABV0QRL5_9TELE